MIVVGSATTLATSAYGKTAELITGTYQNIGAGVLILVAKGSVTGVNASLSVGGVPLVSDQPIPYFGATGTLSINDNVVVSQLVNGGKVELSFRNTTAGTPTVDYAVFYQP